MKSPLFNALGGAHGNPMMRQFQQFMTQMRGQNPNAMLDQMVRSGRVTQEQLNAAQQQAQQMRGMFEGMRGMFGF